MCVIHHLLYALLLGLGANQQHITGICHYIIGQPVDHHQLFTVNSKYIASGIIGQHIAILGNVAIAVAWRIVVKGAPCAKVVPSERNALDRKSVV